MSRSRNQRRRTCPARYIDPVTSTGAPSRLAIASAQRTAASGSGSTWMAPGKPDFTARPGRPSPAIPCRHGWLREDDARRCGRSFASIDDGSLLRNIPKTITGGGHSLNRRMASRVTASNLSWLCAPSIQTGGLTVPGIHSNRPGSRADSIPVEIAASEIRVRVERALQPPQLRLWHSPAGIRNCRTSGTGAKTPRAD